MTARHSRTAGSDADVTTTNAVNGVQVFGKWQVVGPSSYWTAYRLISTDPYVFEQHQFGSLAGAIDYAKQQAEREVDE